MDGKLIGIYPRGNSIQIKFTFNGVRHSETLGIKPTKNNLKYAERKRAAVLYDISMGIFDYEKHFPKSKKAKIYSPYTNSTIEQELLEYLDLLKYGDIEHSTFAHYRVIINRDLIPSLGHYLMTEITPDQIRIWLQSLTITNKTKNNILVPLRGMFAKAYQDEKIDKNPLNRVKNLKITRKEPNPFTPKEISKILLAFDGQRRNLFQFAFGTGLRTSEMIALQWSDIDCQNSLINVNSAFVANKLKNTKTKSGTRFISIRSHVYNVLDRQKDYTLQLDKHVFHNPNDNKPWKSDGAIRKTWLYGLKRAGVEYRNPYQTRHTFASMLLTLGENQFSVASEMGHKGVTELERTYGRWIHGINSQLNLTYDDIWSQICHKVDLND